MEQFYFCNEKAYASHRTCWLRVPGRSEFNGARDFASPYTTLQ